jgi:hypothetical protein
VRAIRLRIGIRERARACRVSPGDYELREVAAGAAPGLTEDAIAFYETAYRLYAEGRFQAPRAGRPGQRPVRA